jgi:predicted dehydrogenase
MSAVPVEIKGKTPKVLGVGIIGCGLIGQKRAAHLGSGGNLIACADINISRAENLAKRFGAKALSSWNELLALPQIDIVIIATLHDSLADITLAAIASGKHVLVEKPAARSAEELAPVIVAAKTSNIKVHVGFNHRYHRSLQKAKMIVDSGALGELMFIRARYGHGARLGYDKEWRSDPKLSGGGELIDQGPHLIDLSRWFLGDFSEVQGFAHTYYWNMPVDDNGFMLLKTPKQQVAFLHASCTEWKNLFSMEIYGEDGKLDLSGLGGSYGLEKLTYYKMLPQMGPPETTSWEYPMADDSWAIEMAEIYEDIHQNREPAAGLNDAYQSLKVINQIYKDSGYDHCS